MAEQIQLKWKPLAYNKNSKPSKRNSHSTCSDTKNHKIYLFGGRSKGGANNNLYVLCNDKLDKGWKLIKDIKGDIPSARMDSALAIINDKLYLFGGNNMNNILNDFYCYNILNNEWINLSNKTKGSAPTVRDRHSLTTIHNKLYLFGGSGQTDKYLNDLYVFDPKTLIWTPIYTKNTPDPRYQHCSAALSSFLIISCGKNEHGGLFDFWLLDTAQIHIANNTNNTSLSWQRIQPKQSYAAKMQAQQRWGQSLLSYNRKLIFFGGWNGKNCFNDIIIIDFGINPFRVLLCDIVGKRPSFRTFHSAQLMEDKMIVYGGRNMTKRLNDSYCLLLKDLSGSIEYIEYNKISFNRYEISTKIDQRYAIINYLFELENMNDSGVDELRFEITIEPNSFISKFSADIDHDIYYGEVQEKQEAKQEYDAAKEKKEYGILISQPYKDIVNVFEIKTNLKSKSKIKLNVQIEQHLKKKVNFNELKIELLRNFETFNIKRNFRFISFKYDIRDLSGIYDVVVPQNNDIRIDTNEMESYHCLVDGKIMCSKNNSSTNELILKYKTMREKVDSSVLFDKKSNTFCHVISDIITHSVMKNENEKPEGNILIPRRVIFVLDKSRSMNGTKWNKTIASSIMAVNNLRIGYDRYCFIFFNEYIDIFPQHGLIQTQQENIDKCTKYLENNAVNGSTNINDALLKAIELIKNDIKVCKNEFFVNQILLITDGEPTKSVKNTKEIILNVKKENILNDDKYFNKIAIFSFGIGTDNNNGSWVKDLNHSFLRLLSLNNNGFNCRIKESVADTQLNQYFNILSKPILANINIQYQHKQIQKQYLTNTRFNTLYQGNDIVICGKIKDKNALNSKQLSITTSISAVTAQEIEENNKLIIKPIKISKNVQTNINLVESNEFNERIWAYLQLKQIEENRLMNNDNYNEEKDNGVSALAMKFAFVTPWTSMVVVSHSDKKEIIASLSTIKKRRNGLKNGGYHRRMSFRATSSDLQNGSKKFKSKTKLFVDTKHKKKVLKITDFELKTTLGTGSFGRVRLVKYECEYFALKMMRKSRVIQMKQENHIKSELKILRALNHPFIVNLIASFQDEQFLYLVLELVSGGEFFTLLKRAETLELAHCKFYGAQIVLIFQFLHHNKIVYRDLKPENLLIDVDGFLRLTDFGFAKKLNKTGGYRTWTLCGTPEYIAPEILLNRGHSFSVDWWSLGILLYEMFAGRPPFMDSNPMKVYQKILSCKIEWPRDEKQNNQHMIPKIGREFILRLLTKNISQRIGILEQRAVDVMKHRFFKGVNWKQMLEKSVEKVPWKPELKSKEDTKHFDDYEEDSDNNAEEGQGFKKSDPFLTHF